MKPVVAIDIDDVLLDMMTALFSHYNRTYGTALTDQHYYTKDTEAFNVKDYADALARFEVYFISKAFKELRPLQGVVESIDRLSRHYTFIAVTSRPILLQQITIDWLEEHFKTTIDDVRFTHFIMSSDEPTQKKVAKIDVCKEIGAHYMIEDHLYHAIPVAEVGIKVFLLDKPWNQTDSLPSNIERIKSWEIIEQQLLKEVI